MTDYNINVGKELLPELLSNQDGLAKLVESVLNQVLEAQASEILGADRYERTVVREGYRNGYRPRQLYTRVGPVTLRVPQTRDGSFSTDIFKRYQLKFRKRKNHCTTIKQKIFLTFQKLLTKMPRKD